MGSGQIWITRLSGRGGRGSVCEAIMIILIFEARPKINSVPARFPDWLNVLLLNLSIYLKSCVPSVLSS